jgi:PAS domain S-box-containing protein
VGRTIVRLPWRIGEQEMELSHDLAVSISEAATVHGAFAASLRQICGHAGWAVGMAWTPNARGDALEWQAGWSEPSPGLSGFVSSGRRMTFAPNEGLPGRVWASGAPAWTSDLREAEAFLGTPSAEQAGLKAALGIPVLAGIDCVAVLEFFLADRREEDQVLLESISAAAAQLGSFIRQKQAEDLLRASEERFRMLAETANDGIVSAGPAGTITYCNRQAEGMFGYPAGGLMGQPITALMPERYREDHLRGFRRYLDTGVPKILGTTLELSARRADGTEFPVELSLAGSPPEAEGDPTFTAIVRDTTQRKTLERMRDTFLHAVAHDLRGPLSAVLALTSVLEGDAWQERTTLSPDRRKEVLTRLRSSVEKMRRLINDVLDLERLDHGGATPMRRPTDVGALAQEVLAGLDVPTERSVEIETEPLVASVDPVQVERIVENLIANCLRHTPATSPIWVRVRAAEGGVRIEVDDGGAGVPEAERESIFQPFQQSRSPGGLGIGLSIVARFAELHGGRAWVEERPGGGAAFRVFLPGMPSG